MAYIDSELAKRRVPEGQLQVHADTQISNEMPAPKVSQGGKDIAATQRQPATIGKLQEIDLGEEARARNIERTNNARRRLDGEEVIEETADGGGAGKKKKKVRLNRDGTVWKPRRRRGSDDVKRDELVEAVLRENRRTSLPSSYSTTSQRTNTNFPQSSTTSLPLPRLPPTTTTPEQQTTASRTPSGATSWMLCLHDRERRLFLRRW